MNSSLKIIISSLFILILLLPACYIEDETENLSSINTGNDSDEDNDEDDLVDKEICDSRDSCQDSCDYIFRKSEIRRRCYSLDFKDVNKLETVFDVIASNSITQSKLNKLRERDFEFFLDFDVSGWTDIVNGDRDSGKDEVRDAYSASESKLILEWIEDEDSPASEALAEVLDDNDKEDEVKELMYKLFSRLSYGSSGSLFNSTNQANFLLDHTDGSNYEIIQWYNDNEQLEIKKVVDGDSTKIALPLDELEDFFEFVMGYIGIASASTSSSGIGLHFDNESFISLVGQDHDDAIELAHGAAEYFCERATGEDDDDKEVKQCLQSLYCSTRYVESQTTPNGEGLFSSPDDIEGNATTVIASDRSNDIFEILDDAGFDSSDRFCNFDDLTGNAIDNQF